MRYNIPKDTLWVIDKMKWGLQSLALGALHMLVRGSTQGWNNQCVRWTLKWITERKAALYVSLYNGKSRSMEALEEKTDSFSCMLFALHS